MRKLIVFFAVLFMAAVVRAGDPVPIPWDPSHGDGGGKHMPALVPSASHDGSEVTLYSSASIPSVSVTVTSESGEVVYTGTLSLSSGVPCMFDLGDVDAGSYVLEVSYGSIYLCGIFYVVSE